MRVKRGFAVAVLLALGLPACEAAYGPTAPTADWSTRDSTRFTLYAHPGSFAETNAAALLEVMDDQYAYTSALFGFADGPHISTFLYEHGSQLTPPLPEARAGVAFPDTNAVHAVAFAPIDNDLRGLLAHEVNHVILQAGLGRAGTSFMNEGMATAVVSERLGANGPTAAHAWVRTNRARLPLLADLIDDSKWSSASNAGYNTAASFLAFLVNRYGTTALRRLYYAQSADFARRAAEVYGKPLEALQEEWLNGI